nr:MAG TPA: hypothetical protein [Caudoviricetes sp.]
MINETRISTYQQNYYSLRSFILVCITHFYCLVKNPVSYQFYTFL